MGGWQLEAMKMGLYMVFPVGLFYYFNQADQFEDWMIQIKREMYPPDKLTHRKEFEDCIRQMQERKEREYLRLLEERDKQKGVWWNYLIMFIVDLYEN